VTYAYVFNPRLTPIDFLQYVAGDFRLPTAGKTKSDFLLDLSSFVIARHQKGLTTVLVVDEAHHLPVEVLEEIRLLTNLETSQEKLLQILLVGQPELDEKLDSVDLRQLKQRIALRSHLAPLDTNETKGYIHRRLQLAGSANPGMLFPDDTILEIHRCSHGIARLINTLCENALIQGYARQTRAITPEMIEEIAADFRMNVMHPPSGGVVSGRAGGDDHGTEVQRAAKTLLDLYTYMRRIQSNETDLNADLNDAMGTGVRKHEPYI